MLRVFLEHDKCYKIESYGAGRVWGNRLSKTEKMVISFQPNLKDEGLPGKRW